MIILTVLLGLRGVLWYIRRGVLWYIRQGATVCYDEVANEIFDEFELRWKYRQWNGSKNKISDIA